MARHHYETLQQVFDDAYRGLAAQGFERSMLSMNAISQCAYRGKGNRRCAIGHCIPDNMKPAEVQFLSLLDVDLKVRALFEAVNSEQLAALQQAHDNGRSPDDMKKRLAAFAARNGLTIPSIEGAA